MSRSLTLAMLLLLVATTGVSQEKSSGTLPTEDTVNAFMQQTFGYDSTITWKVASIKPSVAQGLAEVSVVVTNSQGQSAMTLYVTADGKHAMTGEILPFGAKPYAPAHEALLKGANGASKGPAKATATIVEFSDLQCPHCKEAQPTIEKLLAEEPNARFVFQQFPLPMHNWAAKAAGYADCIGRTSNDAFWKFVEGTYAEQANITESNADEKLTAVADKSGVKGADMAACAVKPDTKTRVDQSIALGQAVGVAGTPTLFINGRRIGNVAQVPMEILKGLVEFAAKQ
ncbi:MAG TPA: thioredoxin domain-containing protein [Terriglobales bacterium]|jgi:protein-disulfide isomerase|nr:thioredoxin domain-containing protein [Terriglobales bacterium]